MPLSSLMVHSLKYANAIFVFLLDEIVGMQMQMMYMNKFILVNSQVLCLRVISIKRMHIIKVNSTVRKLRDGETQKLYTNAFFDQFKVLISFQVKNLYST
jgi:hypothetical protein